MPIPKRAAAAAAAITLLLAPAAASADTSSAATISVSGDGSVMVTPDVATLTLSVNRSASRPGVALSQVDRRADAIVAAIKGAGVPASDIQTESIDTSRSTHKTGPKGDRHTVIGYNASETLQVTTTPAIVGHAIDVATRAGAESIDGPDFSFSNPDAGMVAAEQAALTSAKQQADAAAAAIGYVVTGVESIELNPQSGVLPTTSASGSSAVTATPAPTTTVEPGQQEVDATVAVVYTIAPAT